MTQPEIHLHHCCPQWALMVSMLMTLLLWEDIQPTSPFQKRATHTIHFMVNITPQAPTEALAAILLFLAGMAHSQDQGHIAGLGYILGPNAAIGTLLCNVQMPSIECCLASMYFGPEYLMWRQQRDFIATTLPEDNETLLMDVNIDHSLEVSRALGFMMNKMQL
ncbi:hypothetical protein F5J12DRAFT_785004 [Pisolithus orientalis]|uniref:uncharacterized protein n=1 Tax=Pisolithus orientalis TaxID=936130 RepID=UPI00222592BC|nr:uncharacterized protein F5J12DRAFT_785004 [Pisolithus orientalis]KAI5997771.1 hypothetical protein F5J12DRAFT_785004 [Pisolithus orientalis]